MSRVIPQIVGYGIRTEKYKCDGTRPSCKQCTSAKHDCPGYSEDWKFINNGAKLSPKRQKRQSFRPLKTSRSEELAGLVRKRPGFQTHADAALEIRHTTTTNQGPEPLGIPVLDFSMESETALQNLDTELFLPDNLAFDLGNDDVTDANVGDPQPDHFGASGPGPEVSPKLLSSGSGNDFETGLATLAPEFMLESEQEMVFLLRHYTDNLAPCAVHVDWAFKAANYYHQAATNLPHHHAGETALREAGPPILAEVAMASNAILSTYGLLDSNYDELHT
ncbi:hypothetical protein MKX07_003836 [Trichoderma sp. CBMAI-0711]|nr:hypothetical protein MKX07_003836 [Trichoderma sp. CBMAI-0711]